MLDDGIGYLQITEFDDVTVNQFTENFEELKGQGVKGLIIDLRGNPAGKRYFSVRGGGTAAAEGADSSTWRTRTATRLSVNAKGADFDLPMVVLVQ